MSFFLNLDYYLCHLLLIPDLLFLELFFSFKKYGLQLTVLLKKFPWGGLVKILPVVTPLVQRGDVVAMCFFRRLRRG